MSKIYYGCAPLHAGPITSGFDMACARFRPIDPNFATGFSYPLKDLAMRDWFAGDLVTKETSNATMLHTSPSFDDRKAQHSFNLSTIASGFCNSSVSRLASAP
jgi:hypothetical protein